MSTISKKISTREELRDHIHMIHDFLRNSGLGISMTGLKIFNLFYALKLIDTKRNKFKKSLSKLCSWSYLKTLNESDLFLTLIGRADDGENVNSTLDELHDNAKTRNSIFYDIPRDVKEKTYHELFKKVDEIPIADGYNVDLAGKIYEYFIGYDKTSMSELGAYFTDRHITTFIINEIKPKIIFDPNNEDIGYVPSMIDPFGGSGGFTLTYTEFMKEHYGSYINWEDEICKIYHCDLSEDVVKSASLEMFALTGVFPTVGTSGNFKRTNSFAKRYDKTLKYDYVISNPPYGGDKNKKNSEHNGIEKLITKIKSDYPDEEWAKNQINELTKRKKDIEISQKGDSVNIMSCHCDLLHFAKEFGVDNKKNPIIKANDKEACSLLLFMYIVAKGGTVVGVLKEGVFFDSKYSDLRKALIENYNVEQVISIDSDQFENTTTKTSVIIFRNNGRTTKVIFSKLKVNKYDADEFEILDDKLRIVHCQGMIKEDSCDKKGVEKVYVGEATFDDIVNLKVKGKCHYSLNAKKYRNVEIKCSDKYKFVKIGDICSFGGKSKHKARGDHIKDDGKYNFYTSSETIKKSDFNDYTEPHVMIGTGGNSCLHMDSNFSCSSDMILLKPKPKLDIGYIYHILSLTWDRLTDMMHGSTIKHVTKSMLDTFQIPIPRTDKLLKEWVKKISTPYDAIQQKKQKLVALEEKVKLEVQRIGDKERCNMVPLGELCEYIKTGKNKTPDDKKGTMYPYYGTASITGYTDHYLFDGEHLLVARNGTIGNIFYTNNRIYPSDHIFAIKNKKEYHIKYMFYQILNRASDIDKISNGSTIKGLNIPDLGNIKIPIPRDATIIQNLEKDFKKIETLQQEIKDSETEYNHVLQELLSDIKLETTTPDKSNSPDNNNQDTETMGHDARDNEMDQKKSIKKKKVVWKSDYQDNDNNDTMTIELSASDGIDVETPDNKKKVKKSMDNPVNKSNKCVVKKETGKMAVVKKEIRKMKVIKRKD